jgi:hypothetical protein
MPPTSVKSDIAETIDSEIQPKADALEKDAVEQKQKMQALVNKVSDAIRASNQPLIKRELEALEEFRMGPYAALITGTNNLLVELAKLKTEDETGDDFKQIEALTKSLGELKRKLDNNYAALKALENKANHVLEDSAHAGGDARKEWAAMEAWLKAQLAAAKLHYQAMVTLKDLAEKALDAGDQSDLADAIKHSQVRSTWEPLQKEIEEKFSKFCDKCESNGLSKDLQDQLARDRVAFQKIVDDLAGLNKKMDELHKDVQNMKIAPLDFNRLAAVLKVPTTHVAKLKKALELEGKAREKALTDLQQELKIKFSAKDMASLMKAKRASR